MTAATPGPRADALVLFGATGDLAYKMIFPALQAMVRRGHLNIPVIGVAKAGWNRDQLLDRIRASLAEHGGVDADAFGKLGALLRYVDGDYNDGSTFEELRRQLAGAQRPVHYLAIPPSMFPVVINHLGDSGCAQNARIIVEKPFGRDLASARQLNETIHEAIRDEVVKVFRQIRPLAPADIIRGQFRGYRREAGVAADSSVETFAAMRLDIDSWRWEGVPFFIRTGKMLPVTATEVMVTLKRPPMTRMAAGTGNYFRLRLGPQVTLALGAMVKKPGEAMVGEPTELSLVHHPVGDEMSAYERLLGDAVAGDATLFARQDAVENAWKVVENILGDATPVHSYDPGS